MIMTGDLAKLQKNYQTAGVLGKWTVTRHEPTLGKSELNFSAIVLSCNQYWSKQSPFILGLWMGGAWWCWEDVLPENEINDKEIFRAHLVEDPTARLTF